MASMVNDPLISTLYAQRAFEAFLVCLAK